MRKYFLTGLALLLPLTLTIIVVVFLVNLLTDPFLGAVKGMMDAFGILSGTQFQVILSQALILLFLFMSTALVGFLARWVVVHYFIRFGDYILHRIPFIKTIYKTSQDVFKTIFMSDSKSFKQVVMVPFPHAESRTIGLMTKEDLTAIDQTGRVAVFVPTTPNPTSGYLVMYKKEDVVFLDMEIEDALKYVISCGVIQTEIKTC